MPVHKFIDESESERVFNFKSVGILQ